MKLQLLLLCGLVAALFVADSHAQMGDDEHKTEEDHGAYDEEKKPEEEGGRGEEEGGRGGEEQRMQFNPLEAMLTMKLMAAQRGGGGGIMDKMLLLQLMSGKMEEKEKMAMMTQLLGIDPRLMAMMAKMKKEAMKNCPKPPQPKPKPPMRPHRPHVCAVKNSTGAEVCPHRTCPPGLMCSSKAHHIHVEKKNATVHFCERPCLAIRVKDGAAMMVHPCPRGLHCSVEGEMHQYNHSDMSVHFCEHRKPKMSPDGEEMKPDEVRYDKYFKPAAMKPNGPRTRRDAHVQPTVTGRNGPPSAPGQKPEMPPKKPEDGEEEKKQEEDGPHHCPNEAMDGKMTEGRGWHEYTDDERHKMVTYWEKLEGMMNDKMDAYKKKMEEYKKKMQPQPKPEPERKPDGQNPLLMMLILRELQNQGGGGGGGMRGGAGAGGQGRGQGQGSYGQGQGRGMGGGPQGGPVGRFMQGGGMQGMARGGGRY